MSSCATSAATAANAIETTLMSTTRRSTGIAAIGTWADSSVVPIEGETGNPWLTVAPFSISCATTAPLLHRMILLKKHGRRTFARHLAGEGGQQLCQLFSLSRRHLRDGLDD